jgi:hypothetical protein
MSVFLSGMFVGCVLTIAVFIAGVWLAASLEAVIEEALCPKPQLLPVRVRTEEEQRQYDDCNRTIRPGYVSYLVRVKRD